MSNLQNVLQFGLFISWVQEWFAPMKPARNVQVALCIKVRHDYKKQMSQNFILVTGWGH